MSVFESCSLIYKCAWRSRVEKCHSTCTYLAHCTRIFLGMFRFINDRFHYLAHRMEHTWPRKQRNDRRYRFWKKQQKEAEKSSSTTIVKSPAHGAVGGTSGEPPKSKASAMTPTGIQLDALDDQQMDTDTSKRHEH